VGRKISRWAIGDTLGCNGTPVGRDRAAKICRVFFEAILSGSSSMASASSNNLAPDGAASPPSAASRHASHFARAGFAPSSKRPRRDEGKRGGHRQQRVASNRWSAPAKHVFGSDDRASWERNESKAVREATARSLKEAGRTSSDAISID